MAEGQTKLFVGQIPKSMLEADVQSLFETYGTIVEFSILRDRSTGMSKGCAFLTYTSRIEAEACIAALHNSYTCPGMPSPLQIKYAGTANERSSENKLFIGMVPKSAQEEDLRPIFGPFGEIDELTMLRDPSGGSKGCAFLRYRNIESATAAIGALNGTFKMPGSPANLVVKFAESEKQRTQKSVGMMGGGGGGNPNMIGLGAMGGGYAGVNLASQMAMNQQNYWDPYGQLGAMGALGAYGNSYNPQAALQALYGGYAQMPAAAMSGGGLGGGLGGLGGLGGVGGGMGGGGGGGSAGAAGLGSNKEGPPGANLFIYHLPKEYSDADLLSLFSPYGSIESCKVVVDKDTGLSRCFGFVSYSSPESAPVAIEQLNGFQIGGKRLKVELKGSKSAGGGGGMGGGYRPY